MTDTTFSDTICSLFARTIKELTADDGLSRQEIEAAEQKLGFRLAKPLRDYYSKTGNTHFNQAFNRYYDLIDIEVQGDMAIFCEENQNTVYYGFKISDTEQDDPEVWQLNPTEKKWYFDCKRMTSFLLKMVCWQAVCGGVSASAMGVISSKSYEQIEAAYDRVEFGDVDHDYDLHAFHKDSLIVCAFLDGYRCHVYFGSNDGDKINQVAEQFDLDIL